MIVLIFRSLFDYIKCITQHGNVYNPMKLEKKFLLARPTDEGTF